MGDQLITGVCQTLTSAMQLQLIKVRFFSIVTYELIRIPMIVPTMTVVVTSQYFLTLQKRFLIRFNLQVSDEIEYLFLVFFIFLVFRF